MTRANGYATGVFGTWPPLAPMFQPHTVQLWWDPINGADINPGTMQTRPVATAERIRSLIAEVTPVPVTVNMRTGFYVLPSAGLFLPPRMLSGPVRFRANPTWDPTVFTVLKAEAAGAGTTDASIVLTGMVDNEFQGRTLEVTSGGVVQRKTIRSNTATTVEPVDAFLIPPAEGDAVRILTSNAVFVLPPAPTLERGLYMFAGDQPTCPALLYNFLTQASNEGQAGVVLEGVKLANQAEPSYGAYGFGAMDLFLYGVESTEDFTNSGALFFIGTHVHAGVDLDALDGGENLLDYGWGLHTENIKPFTLHGGWFIGHCVASGDGGQFPESFGGSRIIMLGGRAVRLLTDECLVLMFGPFDITIPFLLDAGGTASAALALTSSLAQFLTYGAINIQGGGAGITLASGAVMEMQGDLVTGGTDAGNAVGIQGAAHMLIYGAPQFGDAVATDWVVFGTAPVNKSFFAAPGDTLLGADSVSWASRVT